MSLYGTCPISLLSVGLSLKIFLLKISLISTYKMPPHLLSNLLKALRYLSGNIRNIGISSCCLATTWSFPTGSDITRLICIWTWRLSHVASMENWPKFEYFDPHISAFLSDIKPNKVASFSPSSVKKLKPIPTDNREIEVHVLTIIP